MSLEKHYKVATLAELLDLSADTIENAVLAGDLRSVRARGKGHRLIPESSVNEWLRQENVRVDTGSIVSIDRRRTA